MNKNKHFNAICNRDECLNLSNNVEQNKSYMLHYSIYIIFKNKKTQCIILEIRIFVNLGE